MKKTTLLIFLGLIAASGAGAFAFGEGILDDIIEEYQDEEETVISEEEPEVSLVKPEEEQIDLREMTRNFLSMK